VIIPFAMIPKLFEFLSDGMNVKPLLCDAPGASTGPDAGKALAGNGRYSLSAIVGSAYALARFRRGCVPSPAFFARWLRFFA
jgi:hypothetical protein